MNHADAGGRPGRFGGRPRSGLAAPAGASGEVVVSAVAHRCVGAIAAVAGRRLRRCSSTAAAVGPGLVAPLIAGHLLGAASGRPMVVPSPVRPMSSADRGRRERGPGRRAGRRRHLRSDGRAARPAAAGSCSAGPARRAVCSCPSAGFLVAFGLLCPVRLDRRRAAAAGSRPWSSRWPRSPSSTSSSGCSSTSRCPRAARTAIGGRADARQPPPRLPDRADARRTCSGASSACSSGTVIGLLPGPRLHDRRRGAAAADARASSRSPR